MKTKAAEKHRWILCCTTWGGKPHFDLNDMPFSDEDLNRYMQSQSESFRWDWWRDVSTGLSKLLTLYKTDRRATAEMIRRVALHAIAGHYNTALRTKLARVVSPELHPDITSKLTALPDKEADGIDVQWCIQTFNNACVMMRGLCDVHERLLKAAISEIEVDPTK